jgi:hypothetical protein
MAIPAPTKSPTLIAKVCALLCLAAAIAAPAGRDPGLPSGRMSGAAAVPCVGDTESGGAVEVAGGIACCGSATCLVTGDVVS